MELHHDEVRSHTATLEEKPGKRQCVRILKQVTHTGSHTHKHLKEREDIGWNANEQGMHAHAPVHSKAHTHTHEVDIWEHCS